MNDVRIRWLLDVVDQGGPKHLLAQDRQLQKSLEQTDALYKRTSTTATGMAARQVQASREVSTAAQAEGRARAVASDEVTRYAAAQREALLIGSKIITQSGQVERGYGKQAAGAKAAGAASANASRGAKKHAEEAVAANALLTGSFTRMARTAVTAGGGFLAAYIGIAKARSAVHGTLELAHSAEILHRNLGLTVKSASAFAAVAKSREIDINSLGMGFQTLSRNAEAAAEGSSKQMKAFHSLGVTQADLVSGTTDFAGLIGNVADAFDRMPGGVQRAALANQLLGRGYRSLLPLLSDGRQGLIDTLGAADKYGATLDEKGIKKTLELLKAQRQLSLASMGLKIAFTQAATPAMLSLSRVAETVSRDLSGPGSLDDKLSKIGHDTAPQLTKVEHLFEAAIPKIANEVGRDAPKIATSFVHGFEHADVWGKSVLGLIFLKKIGALGVGGGLVARGMNNAGSAAAGYFTTAFSKKAAIELEASMAANGELGTGAAAGGRVMGSTAGKAFGALLVAGMVAETIHLLPGAVDKIKGYLDNIHLSVSLNPLHPHIGITYGPYSNLPPGAHVLPPGTTKPNPNRQPLGGRGGGIVVPAFVGGGLVPAMVSSGELLAYGGSSMVVPGAPVAADNVLAMVPPGTAVFTGSGQAMLAAGYDPESVLAMQAPHFGGGGKVPTFDFSNVPGLKPIPKNLPKKGQNILASDPQPAAGANGSFVATAYGPPWTGINGTGVTATGVDLRKSPHVPIVAVDPSVIPLHSKLHVWPNPFGQKNLTFLAEDTGSAIKGHHIDIYDWKGRGDQMAWGSKQVSVSVAGSGRKGTSPLVQYGSELVAGALHAQLRTLRGDQIDRHRLLSPLISDAYSQGYDLGLGGASNVGSLASDLASSIGIQSVRTHRRVRTISLYGGKAGSPKVSGAGGGQAAGDDRSSVTNFDGKPVAKWIAPILSWARKSGYWGGSVNEGWRSYSTQKSYWDGAPGNGLIRGISVAKPGTSNHEGSRYPRGAVDVSDYTGMNAAMSHYNRTPKLHWRGMSDTVHFSADGHRKGGRVRGYRSGGTVGQQVFGPSGITGVKTLDNTGATRALKSITTSITDVSYGGVIALMHRIRSTIVGYLSDHVITPREQAQTLRLRGALTLAQAEIGRRIGVSVAAAQQRYSNAQKYGTFGAAALAIRGVDTSSSAGLGEQNKILVAQKKQYQKALTSLERQYAKAPASLKPQIASIMEGVGQDILQTTVQIAQNARAQVAAAAQEKVDTAQFGVSVVQGALAGLDSAQRLSQTTDTPEGMIARAQAIQQQLLPALGAERNAAAGQWSTAMAQGDVPGARNAYLAVQQAGNDIASAMADAADLLRQAAETAAQNLVDSAAHKTSLATLGEAHLELEQRLAGTFDAGGQQRADYIAQKLIPALNAELDALRNEQNVATQQGDQKLADQIAEAIDAKQNDVLQAQLDAQEAIAANTDPRKFGGTLGFSYGNENLTDQLIAVGNGS